MRNEMHCCSWGYNLTIMRVHIFFYIHYCRVMIMYSAEDRQYMNCILIINLSYGNRMMNEYYY